MNKKFCLWVFMIVIILGILALALWLNLRHQTPSLTIVEFSVPTSNSVHAHPNVYVNLNLKNPNSVYSLTYEYNDFTVKYAHGTLAKTNTLIGPRLSQPKKKDYFMTQSMDADVHEWAALLKELSNSPGGVTIKVELKVGIRYHNLGHTSKLYNLLFTGQFKIGSDGKPLGKKKVKLCKGSC